MPNKAYSVSSAAQIRGMLKPVEWMGSSREDLRDLPGEPRRVVGYALYQAQLGRHPSATKRLTGEFTGLLQIVDDHEGDTYRAVYSVKLAGVVYVLHVFKKKAKHGIATPRRDVALIRARWHRARAHHKIHYGHQVKRHGEA